MTESIQPPEPETYSFLIERAVQEDCAHEDITTKSLIPSDRKGKAEIVAKSRGVFSGGFLIPSLFEHLGSDVNIRVSPDGTKLQEGDVPVQLEGLYRDILSAERIALNFLQRLSGIATETARYVENTGDADVKILDTRKTTPGWRTLEKYAVRTGGGWNHRMNLREMALVKENHIAVLLQEGVEDISSEIARRLSEEENVPVEVEVRNRTELEKILEASPDYILLDNMSPEETKKCVERIRDHNETRGENIVIEASGNIDPDNVASYAGTGVDRISVGRITHSAPALDLSLRIGNKNE